MNTLDKLKKEFEENILGGDTVEVSGAEKVWSFIKDIYTQGRKEGYKEGFHAYEEKAKKNFGYKPPKTYEQGREEERKRIRQILVDTAIEGKKDPDEWKGAMLFVRTLKKIDSKK